MTLSDPMLLDGTQSSAATDMDLDDAITDRMKNTP